MKVNMPQQTEGMKSYRSMPKYESEQSSICLFILLVNFKISSQGATLR